MNELPFDVPLNQSDAAYELQRPVEAVSPLAEALDRVGLSNAAKEEFMAATGLTAGLVDKVWVAVKLAGGDVGMLVYRLRTAAAAMEAAVNEPSLPRGETRRKWEREARAQTEARLTVERQVEQTRATTRQQLEMIDPAERTRCARAVLEGAPWLRKVVKSQDPLESRILGALTIRYWQRHGRVTSQSLLETRK